MKVSYAASNKAMSKCDLFADFFEHNDVQLIQALMFKLAKVLMKLQQ
jgi:hypothetical protein